MQESNSSVANHCVTAPKFWRKHILQSILNLLHDLKSEFPECARKTLQRKAKPVSSNCIYCTYMGLHYFNLFHFLPRSLETLYLLSYLSSPQNSPKPYRKLHQHLASLRPPQLQSIGQSFLPCTSPGSLSVITAELLDEPTKPQCVLKATIAALTKKGNHCMARIANQQYLPFHCPCWSADCSENTSWILHYLAH